MRLTHMARPVAAALAVAVLLGCASGPIAGRLTVAGREPEPVTLNYESSLFGQSGKLWATLPSGERLAGRYVLMPRAPDYHIVSTLSGAGGSSMICRFKLKEPGVGPDGGGTVQCQLSTGGLIDARF